MKIRNLAAALTVVGGLVAGAFAGIPAAGASEITCQVANGCGTLHGIDAVGTPVSLDAKKQADLGIDIAYPDVPGDRATSFSLVEHQGSGHWTYTDKTFTGNTFSVGGLVITVNASNDGAIQFVYTPTGDAPVPTGTTFSVSLAAGGLSVLPTTVNLVPGIGAQVGSYVGAIPDPAYLHAGIYTVGVTLNSTLGTVTTPTSDGNLVLTVGASAVFEPAQPYYTIVYVTAAGGWTNACVTALPSGLLKNEPCDWGRSPDQDFRFFTSDGKVLSASSVAVPFVSSAQGYAVENIATGKYLESLSGLLPAGLLVPQSDAADALPFTGRQMDANGPSTAVWEFGS